MNKICLHCGESFTKKIGSDSNFKKRKFCSRKCTFEQMVGRIKSKKLEKICVICLKGFMVGEWRQDARCCSQKCEKTFRASEQWRRTMSEVISQVVKEGRHNWYKGGLHETNKAIRRSLNYRLWREAVFKRDNFTCQKCSQHGGELNADHIKPFALFPELRFAIDNGRTLCVPCHKKTPTYGYKLLKGLIAKTI